MYTAFVNETMKIASGQEEMRKEAILQELQMAGQGAKHLFRKLRWSKPGVETAKGLERFAKQPMVETQAMAAKAMPTVHEWTKGINMSGAEIPWWGPMVGTEQVLPKMVSRAATVLSAATPQIAKHAPAAAEAVGRGAKKGLEALGGAVKPTGGVTSVPAWGRL